MKVSQLPRVDTCWKFWKHGPHVVWGMDTAYGESRWILCLGNLKKQDLTLVR